MKIETIKLIHNILEGTSSNRKISIIIRGFILSLIILNVLAVILSSESKLQHSYRNYFDTFEVISVLIFSIEYLIRLIVSSAESRYRGIKGKIRYIFSFYAMVDLLAILPFYLPQLFRIDLRFIRILRIMRVVRLLKISRYSKSLVLLGRVLRKKKSDLFVIVGIILMLVIFTSCLMFSFENEIQPNKFSSITQTIWWSMMTISTVGYGDVYPITPFGKILASLTALLGIGLFALPTAILGSAFIEELHGEKSDYCPHCKKRL